MFILLALMNLDLWFSMVLRFYEFYDSLVLTDMLYFLYILLVYGIEILDLDKMYLGFCPICQ